jgi:hypothetical protein
MSSVMRFDEWQDSNGVPVASGAGGKFSAPGNIIAVKHAIFTGIQDVSIVGGGNAAVTDLSITHTLQNASNKLIMSAYFGAVSNDAGLRGEGGIAVMDGSTLINIGDASGSMTRVTAGGPVAQSGGNIIVGMPSFTTVYEPGDTASHTYTVRVINVNASTQTMKINRNNIDNTAGHPRATSGFMIMEVAG